MWNLKTNKQNRNKKTSQIQRTDWRLPEAEGMELDQMGEKDQKLHTFNYKKNKSWVGKVQLGDFS